MTVFPRRKAIYRIKKLILRLIARARIGAGVISRIPWESTIRILDIIPVRNHSRGLWDYTSQGGREIIRTLSSVCIGHAQINTKISSTSIPISIIIRKIAMQVHRLIRESVHAQRTILIYLLINLRRKHFYNPTIDTQSSARCKNCSPSISVTLDLRNPSI